MSVAMFLPCLVISFLLLLAGGATGIASPGLATTARLLNRARKAKLAIEFLQAHNEARESAGMPPLRWDTGLVRFATQWTRHRRPDCKMVHSGGPYGENMFWYRREKNWTPTRVVAHWVEEQQNYDPRTNKCAPGEMCGHYTQIVWRTTRAVGCARVKCDNDAGYLAVCEYSPRGNYEGESPFDSVLDNENENENENEGG